MASDLLSREIGHGFTHPPAAVRRAPRGPPGEAGLHRSASLPSSPLRHRITAMSSTSDPLSNLRDSIAEVDRALLELLRRRMDLASEVGRFKAASNIPVVVRDVEDRVLTRARQHAESCGVSEEVMAGGVQALMSRPGGGGGGGGRPLRGRGG